MALSNMVKSFELALFSGSDLSVEPEYYKKGLGDEWLDYQRISLEGFDGRVIVALHDVWQQAIAQKKHSVTASVTGYETIIKFGDTMQLKTRFTVKISISF